VTVKAEIERENHLADPAPFSCFFMPLKKGSGPQGLVLVGEDYYIGNKKVATFGHMLDLYPSAVYQEYVSINLNRNLNP
jgi:hypothetical protein